MGLQDWRERRGRVVALASASMVVSAVVAGVGAAGAAQSATVYVAETGGPCFTTTANNAACAPGERANVTIETGDTVTWDFTNGAPGAAHNAAAANDVPADPAWKEYMGPFFTPSTSRRFTQPGVYEFKCS